MIGDEGEQLLKEYVKSMSGIKDDDDKIIGFDPGETPVKAAQLERLLFPPNREDITDTMAFVIKSTYPIKGNKDMRTPEMKGLEMMQKILGARESEIKELKSVIKNQQTQIDFLKSTAADLFECLMENGYERI